MAEKIALIAHSTNASTTSHDFPSKAEGIAWRIIIGFEAVLLLLQTKTGNALIVKPNLQMMENMSATISLNRTPSIFIDLPSKKETIVWYCVYALEAVVIIAGNSPTIVLFALNKRLHKKSLFLIFHMAFADLLYGAVLTPFKIYLMHDGYYYQVLTGRRSSTVLSISYTILFALLLQIVLISAALISGERFYAIHWPLKHRLLSIRTYYVVISILWTLAFLVSMLFSVIL